MLSINVYGDKGLVIFKKEDFELEITTYNPEDAIILGQILYRSKVKIIKRVPEGKKRGKIDWSKYISPATLRKIESVMKEMGTFTTRDVMVESGFSKATILRALKVLSEKGKVKIDKKTRKITYIS